MVLAQWLLGLQVPYRALQEHCNLWRNWVDIQSDWGSLASIIVFWAEASLRSEGFRQAAAPGSWNDPDMLIIGNPVTHLLPTRLFPALFQTPIAFIEGNHEGTPLTTMHPLA